MPNRKLKQIAKNIYTKLPDMLQEQVVKLFVNCKLNKVKSLRTPTALIFFITARCNNRCSHCFYWQDLNASTNELSLEEISMIAKSLCHPVHLSLTGGEPFLRKDVVDICKIFHDQNSCTNIGLATNGYLTERIVSSCRDILRIPLETLSVQVSVDGLEKTHNQIRGVNDGYQKALETVQALVKLSQQDRRFSVAVSMTIQQKNINEVEDLVNQLIPLAVPIRFALVRGQHFGTYGLPAEVANDVDPMENESPIVDLHTLEQLFVRLRDMNESASYRFWSERQQEKIRISLQMMKSKQKQLPCYAGKIDGVLYANGDVALCELTQPVANIRDYDLNVELLWRSDQANRVRDGIRNCFCIHGCNLTTSMTFNPEVVKSVLEERNIHWRK